MADREPCECFPRTAGYVGSHTTWTNDAGVSNEGHAASCPNNPQNLARADRPEILGLGYDDLTPASRQRIYNARGHLSDALGFLAAPLPEQSEEPTTETEQERET